jgi:hypothetical protein
VFVHSGVTFALLFFPKDLSSLLTSYSIQQEPPMTDGTSRPYDYSLRKEG